MTDTTFPLTYDVIETLFKNGVCLSYNPTEPMSAWQYGKQLQTDFMKQNGVKRCRLVSKTAKLWQRNYNPVFHYFSDGSLIYSRWLKENGAPEVLERIKTMLKIRGYKVNKIYAPQTQIDFFNYDKMLRYITEQSLIRYLYTEDLSVVPFPNKEEFIKECFYEGNVLLTASKDENIPPECRNYLALFADGRYFISENYQRAIANFAKITQFEMKNSDCLRMEMEYVPHDYIAALYAKAAEYDWFELPEITAQKQKMGVNGLLKRQKYIENLFQNRKCVSVLKPDIKGMMLPELEGYALFDDGKLVIAQSRKNFGEDSYFIEQMHEAYPDYEFKVEQVPDYYLPEIYRRLPEYQKGAEAIYLEMLKQKARKLKRMLEITHHEALDMAAQIVGWPSWKAVKIEDESHARNLISHLNWLKQTATERNPENTLQWEYERWQAMQKHPK